MKSPDIETTVGIAEFKARCLELIEDICASKRDYVIVTRNDKPCARLVPVSPNDSFYGCMSGLATMRGSITKPVRVRWKSLK